jgi:hypothetical protein
MNSYAVWEANSGAPFCDRTYTIYFPFSGYYYFRGAADNYATFYLDGRAILFSGGFTGNPSAVSVYVSAGNHTIGYAATNTGGPGGVALTADLAFTGGPGGGAGFAGTSGGGGGGGGATVLYRNTEIVAIAGGGGGGGGGGNVGDANGKNAPTGTYAPGNYIGQYGQDKSGDGGGGGGGGGGYWAGQGGYTTPGDQGAQGGTGGSSLGTIALTANNNLSAGRGQPYYVPGVGEGGIYGGGTGRNGYAVIVLDSAIAYVYNGGAWQDVSQIYVKENGAWRPAKEISVKSNGTWQPVFGAQPPPFVSLPYGFGFLGRPFDLPPEPEPPAPPVPIDYGISDYGGGHVESAPQPPGDAGGGSSKIICQKLSEMGYFDTEMNRADQLFGVQLQQGDPDAYAGYVRWARPVVVLLEGGGSETLRKVVLFWEKDSQKRKDIQSSIVAYYLDKLARPWAEEMAYRMHAPGHTQSNTAGRFIMNVGLPMCRVIGRWGKDNQWPMWAKTLSIWGTVTVLLATIVTISTVDKLLGKLRKLIGK